MLCVCVYGKTTLSICDFISLFINNFEYKFQNTGGYTVYILQWCTVWNAVYAMHIKHHDIQYTMYSHVTVQYCTLYSTKCNIHDTQVWQTVFIKHFELWITDFRIYNDLNLVLKVLKVY